MNLHRVLMNNDELTNMIIGIEDVIIVSCNLETCSGNMRGFSINLFNENSPNILAFMECSFKFTTLNHPYSIRKVEIGINDIYTSTTHDGYGSILMNYLFKICRTFMVHEVGGMIAEKDFDHIDRLEKFYRKFNFDMDIDYEHKKGTINKVLISLEEKQND